MIGKAKAFKKIAHQYNQWFLLKSYHTKRLAKSKIRQVFFTV